MCLYSRWTTQIYLLSVHNQLHLYYLKPLDDAINNLFLPALFSSNTKDKDRQLISLLTKQGCLGIKTICVNASHEYQVSREIIAILVALIASQTFELPDSDDVNRPKVNFTQTRIQIQYERLSKIKSEQSGKTLRSFENWLGAQPLAESGFTLNKHRYTRPPEIYKINKRENNTQVI